MSTENDKVSIDSAIIQQYDDEVMIDVTKLPEGIRYIRVKFESN